jgi:hypothetical protein
MPNDNAETPELELPPEYLLAMADMNDGDPLMEWIDLSAEEYMQLKACLAKMRGLTPGAALPTK